MKTIKYFFEGLYHTIVGLVIALFIFALTSCGSRGDGRNDFMEQYHPASYQDIVDNHKMIEIDGCEYIVYSYTRGYGGYGLMSHKGNCKNPIHEHNK